VRRRSTTPGLQAMPGPFVNVIVAVIIWAGIMRASMSLLAL